MKEPDSTATNKVWVPISPLRLFGAVDAYKPKHHYIYVKRTFLSPVQSMECLAGPSYFLA